MPGTSIGRGNLIVSMALAPTLIPATVTAGSTAGQSFTIKGLQVNDFVRVSYSGSQNSGIGIGDARVISHDTLEINFFNISDTDMAPAPGKYLILLDRAEYGPLPTTAV